MVCSVGSAKMAIMVRIMPAGSFSQTVPEEVGHQKLVSDYVNRELNEADEANLLDEEDMHVFDLNPMTDPLHLVCCNACRKPVKASQYAAHAELCRTLRSTEELVPELDGGAGSKRSRRKERKKAITHDCLSTAKVVAPVDSSVEVVAPVDSSVASSGKNSNKTAVVMPPLKRPKRIAAGTVRPSGGIETAPSISKINNSLKAFPYAAAPLATKMYYSQRNNRLRAAISHMYHCAPETRHYCGKTSPMVSEADMDVSQGSSAKLFSHEELHDLCKKGYWKFPSSGQNPDDMFAQNMEVGLPETRRCQSVNNCLNQSPAEDVLASQVIPAGMMRSRYAPKPHFTSDSGTSLETMQRSNGRVPVV